MRKGSGDNIGTLNVGLYNVDGSDHPDIAGGALATGTISDSDVSDSGYNWIVCTLGTPYALTASTKYAIVVHGDSLSVANVLTWSRDNDGSTSDYPGGDLEWSGDGGSSWSTTTTGDLLFRCRDASTSPDLIVLVGDRITDGAAAASVWAYNTSGELQWTYDTGADAFDVVIDSVNDVYVSGVQGDDGSGSKNLWKFDSVGNKLGGRHVRGTTHAWDLALDSVGRIIVGTGNGAARVAVSLATEEIIASAGTVGGVAVDLVDDSIYLGSGGSYANLRKYASTLGAALWSQTPASGSVVTDIAIMSDQRVICSLNYSAGKKIIYSWDMNGANQLDYDGGVTTNADSVAVDSSDNIYVVTNDTTGKTFIKLNSSFVEQDTIAHGLILRRVVVGSGDDKPYATGLRNGSVLCWQYDSGSLDDMIQCPTDEIEGIAISSGAYVIPTTTKADYYLTASGALNFQGTTWLAQTFTATGSYDMISVKIPFYRQGSPGTTTIALRAVDGVTGKPTGADLVSVSFDGSEITTLSTAEWREFTLVYSLVNGTQYAIVIRTPTGDLFNRLLWGAKLTSPDYPDGAAYGSSDSGATWTIDSVRELNFETIKEILTAPEITAQSGNTEVSIGQQVSLFVTATGEPAPTYQWKKDGVPLSGETSSTLTFYAQSSDIGVYTCVVTNAVGSVTSGGMVLTTTPSAYAYNPFNLPLDADRVT